MAVIWPKIKKRSKTGKKVTVFLKNGNFGLLYMADFDWYSYRLVAGTFGLLEAYCINIYCKPVIFISQMRGLFRFEKGCRFESLLGNEMKGRFQRRDDWEDDYDVTAKKKELHLNWVDLSMNRHIQAKANRQRVVATARQRKTAKWRMLVVHEQEEDDRRWRTSCRTTSAVWECWRAKRMKTISQERNLMSVNER